MIGASIERSPSKYLVIPHLLAGAIAFFILSVLFLIKSDVIRFHFYTPTLLALTHVITLLWINMFIMGSLYQLVPVIFESKLFSEKLAIVNFWLFLIASVGFIYAFWTASFFKLVPVFAGTLFLSVLLFSINIILSFFRAKKKGISGHYIVASAFWFLLTSLLGVLLAFNYQHGFLDNTNFRFLKVHAHFGLIGWFLQLVMGVSITLIPMFLVSHKLRYILVKIAFWLINSGIACLYLSWQFDLHTAFFLISSLMISGSVLLFLMFIYDSYRKRLRKLDIGMKHSMLAFLMLLLPVFLGIILSTDVGKESAYINMAVMIYGFSAFFAFFTNLILGQAFKTLPFIVWLHRYKHLVGKVKTPFPRELYSENIANYQFYAFNLMIMFFLAGLISGNGVIIKISAALMILSAIFFNFNIIKIVFFKKEITQ